MLRLLHIFLIILTSNISFAKWADYSNAAIRKDICNYQITVKKDGSSESVIEEEFEILKDSAREHAAHYTLTYTADNDKIIILEAKTIFKGKEYNVDKKFIEDKPLASSAAGFDQMNQILLAFPKAEIGAKIYIKYKQISTKSPLKNFYDNFFVIGLREWITQANLNIKSELPLHLLVNDPDKVLAVKTDKPDNFNKLDISLIKEIYKDITNEPDNAIPNYNSLTWVSVSSMNSWNDVAIAFAKQNFNKIYAQKLPDIFLEIVEIAKKEKDEVDQINNVTSTLNNKIQYMMDNRTIEGRLMPRNLDQIAKSQLGDCKDFSAATVAILTKMGFKAQFALVFRGRGNFLPEFLPGIGSFNHVFVKVTSKSGKIYWIDPTNIQSMADGIFSDIANKPILILDSLDPSYEKVPNIDPQHAQSIHKREFEILNNNKVIEKGNITLKNEEAVPITGAMLFTSEENLKNFILSQLSGTTLDESNNVSIVMPDLHSRIVKDISIDYSYEQDNRLFKTNLGLGMDLSYNKLGIDNFVHVNKDVVSDIFIGSPNTFKRQTIIRNVDIKNPEALNSNIDTKWLSISRNLNFSNRVLTIDDIITVKSEVIKNDELKSPEFIKLKQDLETDFKDVALIFNN